MFLLDADICIYILNGRYPALKERYDSLRIGDVGTTAIVAAELRYGALHSGRRDANLEKVERFLAPIPHRAFDSAAAIHYADIKQHLVSRGEVIGTMDMLNAAIARSSGSTFVTNNTGELGRVPRLALENWTLPGDA